MTYLDKLLIEARDKLIREGHGNPTFKDGVEWYHSHLTEAAGELDEVTVRDDAFDETDEKTMSVRWAYILARRKQFEQDAARIGLAEQKYLDMRDGHEHVVHKMSIEIKQLEARLAESRQVAAKFHDQWVAEARAAEAKIKELEADNERLNRNNALLEVRLRRLP